MNTVLSFFHLNCLHVLGAAWRHEKKGRIVLLVLLPLLQWGWRKMGGGGPLLRVGSLFCFFCLFWSSSGPPGDPLLLLVLLGPLQYTLEALACAYINLNINIYHVRSPSPCASACFACSAESPAPGCAPCGCPESDEELGIPSHGILAYFV